MALTKVRGSGVESIQTLTIANGLTISDGDISVASGHGFANGMAMVDGDITLASGHGIDFASTSDGTGSSQVELLDDYEEGTWTPANSGLSLTIAGATYTKIGNTVRLNCSMVMPSTSSSNSMAFTGLPFACTSNNEGAGFLSWSNAPYTDGIMIMIQGSTLYFYKNIGDSNAGAAWPQSNFSGSYIRYNAVYTTAS